MFRIKIWIRATPPLFVVWPVLTTVVVETGKLNEKQKRLFNLVSVYLCSCDCGLACCVKVCEKQIHHRVADYKFDINLASLLILGFVSSRLYCVSFLNLAEASWAPCKQRLNFSFGAGGLRTQGKCLRDGLGVAISKVLLLDSVTTIVLRNLSLGCTEVFVWLQLEQMWSVGGRVDEYVGGVCVRGWCWIRGFFWRFVAVASWGQAWVPIRGLWALWPSPIFQKIREFFPP